MPESIGGIDLRNLLSVYVRKLPIDLRTYLLPFIYGLFGGLAAVAFQKSASTIFSIFWQRPSQQATGVAPSAVAWDDQRLALNRGASAIEAPDTSADIVE